MPSGPARMAERIAPEGLHHFRDQGGSHRFHLRVEENGNGLLTVDASRIIHLNPVACDSAWMIFSQLPRNELIKRITGRYQVGRKRASCDLDEFNSVLAEVLRSGGGEPIAFSNISITDFYQTRISAPYRMDLALTYRCNINCGHCYNVSRQMEELSTMQWKGILRQIRDIGIPHVIFTGGEATMRDDLHELVGFAESLGLVTGLLTNGVKLADREYTGTLAEAGLDHIQVTLESSDPDIHNAMTQAQSFSRTVEGIRNSLESGIFTITNTTISRKNWQGVPDTLSFAHELGLTSVALNAIIHSGKAVDGADAIQSEELEGILLDSIHRAKKLNLRLIWYSPTRYCRVNPMELGLGPRRCTAGEYNLCVEPDGSVLPCQSWYQPAGNILTDEWLDIWNSELFLSARNRDWVPEECRGCIHFSICGGGCPLESKTPAACRDSV